MLKTMRKKIAPFVLMILVIAGIIGTSVAASAKVTVGTPQLKKWYKSYDSAEDPNPIGNGVKYMIKWKKVKGADGYQVQKYERTLSQFSSPGAWFKYTPVSQKGCSTSIEFSTALEFKAKVRAYKIINGKRVYGKWSKAVKKKVYRW